MSGLLKCIRTFQFDTHVEMRDITVHGGSDTEWPVSNVTIFNDLEKQREIPTEQSDEESNEEVQRGKES